MAGEGLQSTRGVSCHVNVDSSFDDIRSIPDFRHCERKWVFPTRSNRTIVMEKRVQSAADIVAELLSEAEKLFKLLVIGLLNVFQHHDAEINKSRDVFPLLKTKFTDLSWMRVSDSTDGYGDIAVPASLLLSLTQGSGMIQPNNDRDPRHVEKMLEETHALTITGRVFGTNFLVPEAYVPDLFQNLRICRSGFKNGQSCPVLLPKTPAKVNRESVHKGGALAFWQVGSKKKKRSWLLTQDAMSWWLKGWKLEVTYEEGSDYMHY